MDRKGFKLFDSINPMSKVAVIYVSDPNEAKKNNRIKENKSIYLDEELGRLHEPPEDMYDNEDLKDLIAPDSSLGPYYPHNMRYNKKHI